MRKRKILAIVASVAMVFTQVVPAAAAEAEAGGTVNVPSFVDMPNDWSTTALQNAVANGLISGYDEGGQKYVKPQGSLTRAEMATIVNSAFGADLQAPLSGVTDVAEGAWYSAQMAKAVKMGTFALDTRMRPEDKITRQEAMAVLARAFKLADNESGIASFADAAQVADWAKGSVGAMASAGYVTGNEGNISPLANISRAEFAKIMDNMIAMYIKAPGSYSQAPAKGNVMINAADAVLANANIDGDLIIGDGVGGGNVTLDSVKVSGRMIVRGGGVNSVIIKGDSEIGTVVVTKEDGNVRVALQDNAKATIIYVNDGKDDVILEGTIGTLVINAETPVTVQKADVDKIEVAAAGADLTVAKDTKVKELSVGAEADGASVSVAGTVDTLNASAPETVVKAEDGGVIKEINAEKSASGISIEAAKGATINKVVTEAPKAEIKGDGKVENAVVKGDDTKVNTAGTKMEVADGVTGTTTNGNTVEGGKTVTTTESKPSAGGGSGGGSSDSSSSSSKKNFSITSVELLPDKVVNVKMATLAGISFSASGNTVASAVESNTFTGYVLTLGDYPKAGQTNTISISKSGYNTVTKTLAVPTVTFVADPSEAALAKFETDNTGESMRHKIASGLGLTVAGGDLSKTVTGEVPWATLKNTEDGTDNSNGYLTFVVNVSDAAIKTIELNTGGTDTLADLDNTENVLNNAFWLNLKIYDRASNTSLLREGSFALKNQAGNTIAVAPYKVDASAVNVTGAPPATAASTPIIRTQPASKSVGAYGSVTFSIGVEAPKTGETQTYQWQVKAKGAGGFSPVAGATGTALTIDNVAFSSSGAIYKCEVTNAKASLTSSTVTSSEATLTVTAPAPAKQSVTKASDLNGTNLEPAYEAAGIKFNSKTAGVLEITVPKNVPANATTAALHGGNNPDNPYYAGALVPGPQDAAFVLAIGKGTATADEVFVQEFDANRAQGQIDATNIYQIDLSKPDFTDGNGTLADWFVIADKGGKAVADGEQYQMYYKWYKADGTYLGFTGLTVTIKVEQPPATPVGDAKPESAVAMNYPNDQGGHDSTKTYEGLLGAGGYKFLTSTFTNTKATLTLTKPADLSAVTISAVEAKDYLINSDGALLYGISVDVPADATAVNFVVSGTEITDFDGVTWAISGGDAALGTSTQDGDAANAAGLDVVSASDSVDGSTDVRIFVTAGKLAADGTTWEAVTDATKYVYFKWTKADGTTVYTMFQLERTTEA